MMRESIEVQHGWGLTPKSRGFSTNTFEDILKLEEPKESRGAIPCGMSRSYGDSSLNSGGYRLLSIAYKGIDIDETSGIATCGSGVSIRELEYVAHLKGFLPPVVPGTSFVTLGGAFASDIHGKSQQTDGNFSDHVKSIFVIDRYGEERNFSSESDEFKATAGGMGLTGFISKLQIELKRVEIPMIYQEEVRVKNLNQMFSILDEFEGRFPYTVAWIDLSGKYLGRGLVAGGRFATSDEVIKTKKRNYGFNKNSNSIQIPFLGRHNLMKNPMIRVFNEIWFRKPLKFGLIKYTKFMHPLDSIGNWNKIYGSSGFVQYQFVVPEDYKDCIFEILRLLKESKTASFLTVLKKFGRNGSGFISFPIAGWTLAMDFAADSKNLSEVLNRIDKLVINSGGRIYLTKDSMSNPESIRLMYPELERWKIIKMKMDPTNFWQSDQSRRLELCYIQLTPRAKVFLLGRKIENENILIQDVDIVKINYDLDDATQRVAQISDLLVSQDFDLIILAAGFLGNQPSLSTPEQNAQIINTNFSYTAEVLQCITTGLKLQKHGKILILSSVAAIRPRKSNYVYGAAKAGLDFLARGHQMDLEGTGVDVYIARPGFIHSKMTEGLMPAPFAISAAKAGKYCAEGINKSEKVFYVPGILKYVMLIVRFLPTKILNKLS
jgi:decaprenylphospho-beta-D-ribofuranose 2-oxidase